MTGHLTILHASTKKMSSMFELAAYVSWLLTKLVFPV